jgi:hypothetical protein
VQPSRLANGDQPQLGAQQAKLVVVASGPRVGIAFDAPAFRTRAERALLAFTAES